MDAATEARWIDLGLVDPLTLHATYTGIAYAMGPQDAPVIVWGRATEHLCLGQSQGLCEVDPDAQIQVLRRVLGGGAVWVDESQRCYALVVPLAQAPRHPSQWFGWALSAAQRTFGHFGLRANQVGNDLWVRGRKIAGSGAATVNQAAVVASSFLLDFPTARFVVAVAALSPAYRRWLRDALDLGLTTWSREQAVPGEAALAAAFRSALEAEHGWRLRDSVVAPYEWAHIDEARQELTEPIETGRRLTPDGIKINHRTYLTETRRASSGLRELTVDGAAVRCEAFSC